MAYIVTCKKCGKLTPPPFWDIEPYGRCCMECNGVLWSDYKLAENIVFSLPGESLCSTHVDEVAMKIATYRKSLEPKP